MRIKPYVFGGLVLSVFFGTILVFQVAGIWSVSGRVTTEGGQVSPSAADPNTIKGWMTIEQITSVYSISMADLSAEFGLPTATDPGSQIKDLESERFSVTSLRTWLQSRAAAPVEKSLVPETSIATQFSATDKTLPAIQASPTQSSFPAHAITGKTTFQELVDWGISVDTIRSILGTEMPSPALVIKDFVTAQGLDFPTIKQLIQDEVDRQNY
jgi:hypothetical protein